ncbi:MAG: Hydrolase or acyltransferase of alpha/beta superfamily [Candidatus Gottesmanbacteria bacterium GW2011_GWC2_39_8]|uniref:Hydrolase or acyltransferase of alpha/beta superfamily n=1 Tax=Candidatus Gottesmanbacteria bacterium GW2011_GWC2_39_8 TaxID=1618450 RepID=A0A0G0PUU7_9BACT|nr:MAG: Hydrolase or acyltransferase of alpha/beta superfamily [Candidatus Gottesmanbacteria bacterium GW2011_GWC2_39_8]
MFKIHDHQITVDGTKIYYMKLGHGTPLIFIHGHRGDSRRILPILQRLAKFHTVYAPDMPGFGRSEELHHWHTIEGMVPYILGVVDHLGCEKFVLGGVSMGGTVAALVAQKIPDRIERLVLLGPLFDYHCIKIPRYMYTFVLFLIKIFHPNRPVMWAVNKFVRNDKLFTKLMTRKFPVEDRKPEIIRYELRQWKLMTMKVWAETVYSALRFQFKEKIPHEIPTILIFSEKDQFFDINKDIKGFRELFPNNEVHIMKNIEHVQKGPIRDKFLDKFGHIFAKI